MVYSLVIGIGLIFCFIWSLQIFFVKRHWLWTNLPINLGNKKEDIGISVIHPLKGIDHGLRKNIESWLSQNFKGNVQHIFSFQRDDDPAIEIIKDIKKQYSATDINIVISSPTEKLTGKSSNMIQGLRCAKFDLILFADSDTRVREDLIVKMVMLLEKEKVGAVACGQISIGGNSFWTRVFTYFQNNGINFIWAFCTRYGMDVGLAGAAFVVKKQVLKQLGGLEKFGNNLLEDCCLGRALVKEGYKIAIGPFIDGYVHEVKREEFFNCLKRSAISIKICGLSKVSQLLFFLSWYWVVFFVGLALGDKSLLVLSGVFIILKIFVGLIQRVLTKNQISFMDLAIPIVADILETVSLFQVFLNPTIIWRGVKYKVRSDGQIKEILSS